MSMQYAMTPAGGFRLNAPAGTVGPRTNPGLVSVTGCEPTVKPVAMSGSACATCVQARGALNMHSAASLRCSDHIDLVSFILHAKIRISHVRYVEHRYSHHAREKRTSLREQGTG